MVGVPLSRGCQTCRRRKIKCDEKRPACLRCKKSGLLCAGYPTRLKFIDEGRKFEEKPSQPQWALEQSTPRSLPATPSEKLSLELYQAFKPDLPVIKSLASFSKTSFITALPRHVGLNSACDLSMKAVCLAHATLLKSSRHSLIQSRIQYGRALIELRLCLADPKRARTIGTLCATMLLGIFEQLVCADFIASIRHAGGAARLIEVIGPRQFEEPFAYIMFHALQGAIVIESILYRRRCFLDSPLWRRVCERTQTPFSALFSILSRLPKILSALREPDPIFISATRGSTSLRKQTALLRHDLQTWRDNPAYAELFYTSVHPSTEYFQTNLIYTSNNAISLLCSYAATMILLNSALILVSDSETLLYRLENLMLAKQICQSYEYSRNHSPVGSLAMDFAFRVAYLVPDAQQKDWIVEKINEMASPLGGSDVKAAELEGYFDYLKY